jgi:ATP-dependent DNA helicase RecG
MGGMPRRQADADALLTPVQFLKGVGPERAELLERLGLHVARDVLFFFPRDYEDLSEVRAVQNLEEGSTCSVVGTVEEVDLRDTGGGRSVLGVLLKQDQDYVRAVWFNQPAMLRKFQRGQRVLLSGSAKLRGFRWEMHHPQVAMVGPHETEPTGGIRPVYRLTEGLQQHQIRRIARTAVEEFTQYVPEVLPPALLDTARVWPIQAALPQIHNPADQQSLQQARFRFVYQELLAMQLALGLRRSRNAGDRPAPVLKCDARVDARIKRLLPFALTGGQLRAIEQITADLASPVPMNRLLQGDVGSGKTAVAAYAMLVTVASGHQAVLMAPTELLVMQHLATLEKLLRHSRVRLATLTGSLTPRERADMLARIASGDVDLVVGTQAVVQADVKFARLGLAIIDEQHRFGVLQRARLRQADCEPHSLVMTATPIPRTVSLTLFGDLDVSLLRESPPGRQPIHTYLGSDEQRASWWEFVRRKLREGRQTYVIAPLVDDEDPERPHGAEQVFEALVSGELEAFRVDVVHGRLPAAEQRTCMDRFRAGHTQVLVATSLVEVGVDVPNANLMTIENGERFGLAQLHQLRGRIGRGSYPGYVCIFTGTTATVEARQRLAALAATSDGFELAEIDFQLRGPGDLFGTSQHGLPPLRIADLLRDGEIAEQARADARRLLASDPDLQDPSFAALRRRVWRRYGQVLDLGGVG